MSASKKVLWIGPYRDHTGYGSASLSYLLALDEVGVDVVCRPLKLNNRNEPLPKRILELEAKSSSGCDIVIQHCLPHQMSFNGRFKKNIGLFAWETSNFRNSVWPERLNCMDEVWCINRCQAEACRESGVTKPIVVMPHAADLSRFQRNFKPLPQFPQKNIFRFYFIGEFVRRKNVAALLKAFHSEFEPDEPVELVLKTDVPGKSPEESEAIVRKFCNEIKIGLKVRQEYQAETILTHRMDDENLLRLHASCDAFVCSSHGEAWGIPAFDAMAMGKTPIVTSQGGFLEYLSDSEGWLVDYHEEPVFGAVDSFEDLYTANENWYAVKIEHLKKCMRDAYSQDEVRKKKAENGIRRAYDFSLDAVGDLMKAALYYVKPKS